MKGLRRAGGGGLRVNGKGGDGEGTLLVRM